MGGRGASSSTSRGQNGVPSKVQGGGASFDDVKNRLKKDYGITLSDDLKQVDPAVLSSTVDAIDRMMTEFPQLVGEVGFLGNDPGSSDYAYASWTAVNSTSTIHLGSLMQDKQSAERYLRSDGSYHPPNSTVESTIAHELGHSMETALARRKASSPQELYDIRRGRKIAQSIMIRAANVVKKTPAGQFQPRGSSRTFTKSISTLVGEVSGYASKNRSESLAEAVADYFSNGANAHPLSVAAWDILKKELG